jgi:hypothetical protein
MEGYRDEKDRQKNRRKEAQRSFVLLSPIDLQRTNQAGQNGRGQQKTQKQLSKKYSTDMIPPMTDRFRFNLSRSVYSINVKKAKINPPKPPKHLYFMS